MIYIGEKIGRRITFCLIGAFIYASGVCVVTHSSLGISPISSFPYVLSIVTGMSLGTCTLGLNVILILVQRIVFGKEYTLTKCLLQIAISIIFSVFIDLSIFLFGGFWPQSYLSKLIYLLFGFVVLAVGMSMVVMSNFVVLPGEGAAQCIAKLMKTSFGNAKIIFDSLMVALAVMISLIMLHRMEGIREGTVLAAFMIGAISKVIFRLFKDRVNLFLGFSEANIKEEPVETENFEATELLFEMKE